MSAQILVVEDERITAQDIRQRLQRLGYSIPAIASSGEEALECAATARPDLVLMDISLKGGMDGIETAKLIRERHGIPVAYLTAFADENTLVRAKETAPVGYILKPFEERELHSTIQMGLYRHQLEREVEEGRRWIATVLDAIGDGVIATDADGFVRFINPVAERLTGWNKSDALGQDLSKVFRVARSGSSHTGSLHERAAVWASGSERVVLLSKSGRATPVEVRATIARDDRRGVVGFVWAFCDVTERERAEDALRRNEEHYRSLIEHASDIILVVDSEGTIYYASPSVYRELGYRVDEVLGRAAMEFVHADDARGILQSLTRTETGRTPRGEVRIRHADGTWRVLEATSNRMVDRWGLARIVVNARDVTQRKQAEREMATLLAVARETSGMQDLGQMLARVGEHAASALGADIIVTLYANPGRTHLRLVSQYGLPQALGEELAALEFPFGNEPFGGDLTAGRTVVIGDPETQPEMVRLLCARLSIHALVAVPMHLRGQELGVFIVCRRSPKTFRPDEIQVAEGIARQLVVAIESVERYRNQQEEAAISSAVARVGHELLAALGGADLLTRFCKISAEALDAEVSQTWLWQPEEQAFTPVAGIGLSEEQWESLRVLRAFREADGTIADRLSRGEVVDVDFGRFENVDVVALMTEIGYRSCLVVPLMQSGELVGLQVVASRAPASSFTQRHRRIAAGIAQIGSLALQHARVLEQLARANRIKSDFVATMSHELRTPINAVMGFTDLLLHGEYGPLSEAQKGALRKLHSSARELRELIHSTLDVSRLETGRVPLALENVHCDTLLEQVAREMETYLNKPGVNVKFWADPGLPLLRTDPAKLKVVIKNLVTNAYKFTDHGQVTVDARLRRGGVELSVHDTGPGMSDETMQVLFEPFRQGEAVDRKHGGVGLGLYIVQRIVELLGGSIHVESILGRGSTFTVWLPLAPRASGFPSV